MDSNYLAVSRSCVELLLSLVLQIPGESTSKPGKVVDTGTIGNHSQELSNRASQSWDGKSWKGRLTIVCSCVYALPSSCCALRIVFTIGVIIHVTCSGEHNRQLLSSSSYKLL